MEHLAKHAELKSFEKDAVLFKEDDQAEHFYILVKGEVKLFFESLEPAEGTLPSVNKEILIRNIVEFGRPLGWSCMVEPHRYRASTVTLVPSELLVFERKFIHDMCHKFPKFGVAFMRRILWVLGNRLRATRVRLVAKRYEKEIITIRALLDQSAETLHVNSPLHKIPYYLENRLTLSDAFQCLELLKTNGNEQERNLAALCLDILENVKKELAIFQSLQSIYENVTNAPDQIDAETVRSKSCEEFIKMFELTNYVIQGTEHLPNSPGNIFIMNHLYNHPDNMLPNHFQLNNDVNFVSSMIVYKKYGKAPIRVIRKSFHDEFGHQKYYKHLGFIEVESPKPGEQRTLSKEKNMLGLLNDCQNALAANENVSICPEGQPTYTKNSPLPFKAGAFRIALQLKPEPLIVPIALANFDKKFSHTKLVAVIHKPFYLSEFLSPDADDETLFNFVNSYNEKFKSYVREAVELSNIENQLG